jgi:hypothetical protein
MAWHYLTHPAERVVTRLHHSRKVRCRPLARPITSLVAVSLAVTTLAPGLAQAAQQRLIPFGGHDGCYRIRVHHTARLSLDLSRLPQIPVGHFEGLYLAGKTADDLIGYTVLGTARGVEVFPMGDTTDPMLLRAGSYALTFMSGAPRTQMILRLMGGTVQVKVAKTCAFRHWSAYSPLSAVGRWARRIPAMQERLWILQTAAASGPDVVIADLAVCVRAAADAPCALNDGDIFTAPPGVHEVRLVYLDSAHGLHDQTFSAAIAGGSSGDAGVLIFTPPR